MFFTLGWRCGSDQSGAAQTGSGQESGDGHSQRGHRGGLNVEDGFAFCIVHKTFFLSTKLFNNKKNSGGMNTRHQWKDIYLFHAATHGASHAQYLQPWHSPRIVTCSRSPVIWQAAQTHGVHCKCTSGAAHMTAARGPTEGRVNEFISPSEFTERVTVPFLWGARTSQLPVWKLRKNTLILQSKRETLQCWRLWEGWDNVSANWISTRAYLI